MQRTSQLEGIAELVKTILKVGVLQARLRLRQNQDFRPDPERTSSLPVPVSDEWENYFNLTRMQQIGITTSKKLVIDLLRPTNKHCLLWEPIDFKEAALIYLAESQKYELGSPDENFYAEQHRRYFNEYATRLKRRKLFKP